MTIALLFALSAPAAEPTVAIACPFTAEAAKRYRVEKIKVQDRGQGPTTRHERYEMSLAVAARDGATATVAVDYGDTELLQSDDPLYARIVEAGNAQDVALRLQVDLGATRLAVANMDEVLAGYTAVADVVVAMMKENPAIPEKVIAGTRAMMVDPKIIEPSLTGELRPLFQYTCGEFSRAPVSYEARLPNPFGGDGLPAKGTVTVTEQGGALSFEVTERIDLVNARPLLEPAFARMGVEMPADARLDELPIDVSYEMHVSVDPASGWVTDWRSVRTTKTGPGTSTDELKMTAID